MSHNHFKMSGVLNGFREVREEMKLVSLRHAPLQKSVTCRRGTFRVWCWLQSRTRWSLGGGLSRPHKTNRFPTVVS